MKLKHRLEYGLLRSVVLFLNLLPLPVILVITQSLGWLTWVLFPFRLPVAYRNISTVFPDMAHTEKLRILKRAYLNFTKTFALIVILRRKKLYRMIEEAVISGQEHLDEALKGGKGAVLTTYHGFWFEAYFAWFNHNNLPTSLIIKRQSNPFSDAYFIRQREYFGNSLENVRRKAGMKVFRACLENNRLLIISLDQNYQATGTPIPFFNRTLGCAKGSALLHLKSGAPVLTSVYYVKNGKLHIDFDRVDLPEYQEITEDAINDISTRAISYYEPYIMKYPEQWFSLFHRLWSKDGYPERVPRGFREIFL
ncbi:MAG: hypothetical protein D6B25_17640 [Desulfobulbaceae bacterium]|nr:MAG: hypothetical protein D6B25_17640 [Desulfobulbaceae bacterium]